MPKSLSRLGFSYSILFNNSIGILMVFLFIVLLIVLYYHYKRLCYENKTLLATKVCLIICFVFSKFINHLESSYLINSVSIILNLSVFTLFGDIFRMFSIMFAMLFLLIHLTIFIKAFKCLQN